MAQSLEAQIESIKASIIRTSPIAKLARLVLYAYVTAAIAVFLGVLYFLKTVQRVDSVMLILLALGVVYLTLAGCYRLLDKKYKHLQVAILSKHRSRFQDLELDLNNVMTRCEYAEKAALAEWDSYCVNFDKYPPDWDERKEHVQKTDGFKCTNCGWPTDQKVRRRNLHVHHVTPLSAGGDNSLENLTTLCHICHRKQEDKGHKRIKYRKQDRR